MTIFSSQNRKLSKSCQLKNERQRLEKILSQWNVTWPNKSIIKIILIENWVTMTGWVRKFWVTRMFLNQKKNLSSNVVVWLDYELNESKIDWQILDKILSQCNITQPKKYIIEIVLIKNWVTKIRWMRKFWVTRTSLLTPQKDRSSILLSDYTMN